MIDQIKNADGDYNKTINAIFEILRFLVPYYLPPPADFSDTKPEILLYRGSVCQALVAAYYFLCRVSGDQDQRQFAGIINDELIDLFGVLYDYIDEFYANLADPETAVKLTIFDQR